MPSIDPTLTIITPTGESIGFRNAADMGAAIERVNLGDRPPSSARIPTQLTEAEIRNLRRLCLDARSAAQEFSAAVRGASERAMLDPVAVRQYIVAFATEKLDDLATRNSQIEMLLG